MLDLNEDNVREFLLEIRGSNVDLYAALVREINYIEKVSKTPALFQNVDTMRR